MNIRNGNPITLEEVLDRREERVHQINQLKNDYLNHGILSLKLNIPGPRKNNNMIQFIFNSALKSLPDFKVIYSHLSPQLKTGPEALFVYEISPVELKEALINIEENHPLGRLFDMDVLDINRKALGYSPRKCLICDEPAVDCGRSRKHSVDELLEKIDSLVKKVYNESNRGK